jgi:glycosyltransferase involved in cell wall biosynthesis
MTAQEKMKLLFVCGSLAGGGAEKILTYLINYLDKSRYEVRLLLLERQLDYLAEIDPAVKIDCLNKASRWDFFKLIRGVGRALKEYQPRAVISLLNHVNVITMLGKLYSGSPAKAILCEHSYLHNFFPYVRWGWLKKILMKFSLGRADYVVAVSANIKHCLETEFRIRHDRIRVIYNPIPVAAIVEKSRAEVAHPFFQDPRYKVVIAAGRLVGLKRFDRLLRAFARARREFGDLRLIILGKGELDGELRALAHELEIEAVTAFAGFQENPYAWMAKAHLFALTSDREGFPNVLIEAMACGTPVVSVDCMSGPSEIVTDGVNGFLVPENDEAKLASAILRVVREPDLAGRFTAAGKAFATQFTTERILPQYEQLF